MKRMLMLVLIGAAPIAMLATVLHYVYEKGPPGDEVAMGLATGLGALWGFITGVFRRSLLRTMIGLNIGGACGFGWFKLADPLGNSGSLHTTILFLALAGGIAGALLNATRKDALASLLRGFLAGIAAFAFMGYAAWMVASEFRENLLGWTVMCLVPFGGGIAIFLSLLGRESSEGTAPVAAVKPSLPERRADEAAVSTEKPVGAAARID